MSFSNDWSAVGLLGDREYSCHCEVLRAHVEMGALNKCSYNNKTSLGTGSALQCSAGRGSVQMWMDYRCAVFSRYRQSPDVFRRYRQSPDVSGRYRQYSVVFGRYRVQMCSVGTGRVQMCPVGTGSIL